MRELTEQEVLAAPAIIQTIWALAKLKKPVGMIMYLKATELYPQYFQTTETKNPA